MQLKFPILQIRKLRHNLHGTFSENPSASQDQLGCLSFKAVVRIYTLRSEVLGKIALPLCSSVCLSEKCE